MTKCIKYDVIIDGNVPMLCPECFFVEFEKKTGKKPVWKYDEKTKEWKEVYEGIGLKEPEE